jgi:endonuclease/exonuclease/phosphatase family metal-dependent hydrolase
LLRALFVLVSSLLAACSNPNYSLEACVMNGDAYATGRLERLTSDLRLMTLNMWGIRFVSADIDARFDALAERLNADDSIDVVGLQEVWADAPRKRLLQKVAAKYPHQADFQSSHGRSGLAILSRHPFEGQPHFIPFPKTGKWWKPWTGEWLGGKGIGAVKIKTASGPSWLFVTHLHACYADGAPGACDGDDEYGFYRGDQLQTLRATVNEVAGDAPALILGDFNFTVGSKYYQALTSNGVYPPENHDPAWERVEEPQGSDTRIDFVWVRPGRSGSWLTVEPARTLFEDPIASANGKRVPLSDHCAVAATLRRSDVQTSGPGSREAGQE